MHKRYITFGGVVMFPNDSDDNGVKSEENQTEINPRSIQSDSSQGVPVSSEAPYSPAVTPMTTTTPAPAGTTAPDASTFFQSGTTTPYKNKKSKKRLILGSCLTLLILGGFAAYALLIFIPSKPANVYAKAMSRSGEALDKVVNRVTEKSQLDRFKKGEYSGIAKVDAAPLKIDATMQLKYDKKRVDFKSDAKLSEDGQTEKNYSAKFLSEIKDGTTYPDIYFIISGIKDLGLEGFAPGVNSLDNTWIKVDEKYLKDTIDKLESVLSSGGDTDVTQQTPEFTDDDAAELSRIFTAVVKDYVLTDDTSKGILVNKSFSGKEKIDGLNTHHYVIGINKDNYQKACVDSANRFLDSSAYKKLAQATPDDIKKSKQDAEKGCVDSKNGIKDDETFDMWVDAKYKLIYKIRDYDDDNKEAYFEIGQKYNGGDDLHFFAKYDDSKNKIIGRFNVDLNTKTLVSKSSLLVDFESDGQKGKVELTIDGKPIDGDITIDKPSNPKPIQDVIKELGLDSGDQVLDPLGIDASYPFTTDLQL